MKNNLTSSDNFASSDSFYKKSKRRLGGIVSGRCLIIIVSLLLQAAIAIYTIFGFEGYLKVALKSFVIIPIIMILLIASSNDNPAIKLSWTALIMVFPIFGATLYLYLKFDLGHRIMYRLLEKIQKETRYLLPQNDDVYNSAKSVDKGLSNIATYLFKNGPFPIYNNCKTRHFPSGEEMFCELVLQLEKAEKFIFLEYFIIEEGEMWGEILEILQRKVKNGIDVRVMYDGTCSVSLLPFNYSETLQKLGIKCKEFSPLRPFVSTHYNNRDHRKIAVIDGKVAFTGGVNLADEYINKKIRFGHWKDCGIMIEGSAVSSFALMFLQVWNLRNKEDDFSQYLNCSTDKFNDNGFVIPYSDSPLDNEKTAENIYLDIINKANNYVYIMTPYLIIDNELSTALTSASLRGVDVRIIIPHTPDHKSAFAIAKSFYHELVYKGVKIYEYTPGFVHSKLFLSDDIKAVSGTINLDYRSLYLHFECGVYMYGTSAVEEIKKDFDETFEKCNLIDKDSLKKKRFFTRVKDGFLRLFAPLM